MRDARRAVYREAILDAAERAFAGASYQAARVQEIAAQAGVSLATFYATFPKKLDLYRAIHARRLDALMLEIAAGQAAEATVLERIVSGVRSYLTYLMEHPDYLRMHLQERIAWTSTDGLRSPEQAQAWRAGLKMMIAAFEHGIAEGSFDDDDPELMARTLIGMHQVRLALWIERGQQEAPAEVAGAAARQLIRCFCPPARHGELLARAGVTTER